VANTQFEVDRKNMITERFSQALAVAIEAHDGQQRKGTTIPYISHPIGVASIALEYGANEDQAIAALLHDVLEEAEPYRAEAKRWKHWALVPAGHMLGLS
jgi:(p)ppGpp synthase/HD superfamily hydrolase